MLCPTCNQPNQVSSQLCISCGTSLTVTNISPQILPSGTTLGQNRYIIQNLIGQGGFGITYKAQDTSLNRPVAIKEFFCEGCHRQGKTVISSGRWNANIYHQLKQKFFQEGQTLAQFNHPGIVKVFDCFEENNTAYIVMEYLQGQNLAKLLEKSGKPLPEAEALNYIEKVGYALEVIHQANFLHRDIKPDNIMLTIDQRIVLIDFGSARSFMVNKTQKLTAMLTPEYAPLEQYIEKAKFGVVTDIYALGATLYHLLTGIMPVSAVERVAGVELKSVKELNPTIRSCVAEAIKQAMAMRVQERAQSVKDFLNLLQGRKPTHSNSMRESPFYQSYLDPWDAFESSNPDNSSKQSNDWF